MSPHELANKLEEPTAIGFSQYAADMLRQLANEKAELEEKITDAKLFIESTCHDGFVDEVFRDKL